MAKPTRFAPNTEPIHIFQDNFFDQTANISRAPMPSVASHQQQHHHHLLQASPRKALHSAAGNGAAMFHPHHGFGKQNSPFKATGRATTSPLTPLKAHVNKMKAGVALHPPAGHHHMATDSMQKRQPIMSRFKTVYQKPVMEETMPMGKENMHPTLYPAPPTAFSLNIESFYQQKPPAKRQLLEAAPIKETRSMKMSPGDDRESVLPPHDSFPPLMDDGQKPPHSYAVLIAMAILRSPQRRLTLSQIYKWISDTYSFYSASEASGWQNSIRHNLSLNKAFIKQERPKGDTGKGHYWAIEPGMEGQFIKDKPVRKSQGGVENVSIMCMSTSRIEPAPLDQTIFQDGLPSLPTPILPAQPVVYPPTSVSTSTAIPTTSAPEVSSDATIPLSDNGLPEESSGKLEPDMTTDANLYSPAMHSSPPIPRHMDRSNTPPPMSRVPASSGARTHKRKFASMDDSGYISSLESSAMRPNQGSRGLNSDADLPRIKRGRAEEEIARLRASSYDSPTKARSHGFPPPSSSPLRQANGSSQMPPPLTPALKKRAPVLKPPPSVSPNTNLRLHRDEMKRMLDSPLRRASNLGDDMPFSPNFNLDHTLYFNDFVNDGNEFDIFQDGALDTSFFNLADNGSPIKRSAKRLRMERSHSANALGDITNNNNAPSHRISSSAYLKVPEAFPMPYETPSKVFEGMSSPGKYFQQSPIAARTASPLKDGAWQGSLHDFCMTTFFEDENDENSGLDILQGFEKIGSTKPANGANASKPPLGRSYTTTF
jgi:forkhead transcription factor HCM1